MHEVNHPGRECNPQGCDQTDYKNGFAKNALENSEEGKDTNRFGINHIFPIHLAMQQRICNHDVG